MESNRYRNSFKADEMNKGVRFFLLLALSAASFLPSTNAAGGELATFTELQMSANVSYRQDLCDLYHRVTNESDPLQLRDALNGIQLRTLMADYTGAYFNYDEETGINPLNPGLQAVLMDELARRAGFTWRESFGVFKDPTEESWDELLEWSTDVYDISVDWWAQNLRRINAGIAFLTPWYDSSVIMIKREIPPEISNEVNWWNWLRPFEPSVWYLSLATIVLSGLVYQFLEWLADDRQGRPFWDWFNMNCYLSIINFTQASYEYQPRTFSGRIFGASMAIWALVMTATYTANLASLLVDRKEPPPQIFTIAEAAHYGAKVCTIEGYVSDTYIQSAYPSADRLPLKNVEEIYKALHRGDCQFAADTVASWESKVGDRKFNPTCDMVWVGGDRKVLQSGAGFAIKADSGDKCTGLIQNVFNYHMQEMITAGFLQIAWDQENRGDQCASYRPDLEALSPDEDTSEEPPTRRRNLLSPQKHPVNPLGRRYQRRLKGGASRGGAAGGAASVGDGDGGSEALTMEQMLGSFIFHWLMLVVSISVALLNKLHERYVKRHAMKALDILGDSIVESTHIGVIAKKTRRASAAVINKIDQKLGGQSEQMGNRERMDSSGRKSSNGSGNDSTALEPPSFLRGGSGATLTSSEDNTSSSRINTSGQPQPVNDTTLVQELRNEIASMKKSQLEAQASMQDMQRQMLVEQWRLQEQILQLATAQVTASPFSPIPPTSVPTPYAWPPAICDFKDEQENP